MKKNALGIPKQHGGKSCKRLRKGCFKSLEVKEEIKGASLVIAGIKYPTTDGKKDQRLKTDGNGKLSWTSPPGTTELPISSIKFSGQYHSISETLTLDDNGNPKYSKRDVKYLTIFTQLEENPAFFTLKSTTISRWSKLGSLFKEGGLIKGKSIGTSDGQLIEDFHNFKIDKNNIVISFDTIIRIHTPDGDPDAASRIVQKTYTRVVAAV